MKTIESILTSDIIQALGWAVLHSIWQALVIAFVILLLQAVFRQMGTHFKYVLYATGLFAMLVSLVFTFADAYGALQAMPEPVITDTVVPDFSVQPAAEVYPERPLPASIPYGLLLKDHIGLITICWLLGAVLFSLRLFGSLLYVQRLISKGTHELSAEWSQKLQSMANQLGIRKSISLLSSVIAETPVVIGHFKPVILLPAGLFTGLTMDQVEAVLAHELAHIRRNDWIVNLLQSMVETLFFFHPVVWWLSARIREEREKCCDDIAVQMTGDAFTYVRALSAMQEVKGSSLTMAMAFGKKKYLLERVRRLISPDHQEKILSVRLVLPLLVLICIAAFTFVPKQDNPEGGNPEVLQSEISPVFAEKNKTQPFERDTLPDGNDRQQNQQEETDKEKKNAETDKKDRNEGAASGWDDSSWDEETVHEDFHPFHFSEPVLPPDVDSLLGSLPPGIFNFPDPLFDSEGFNGFPFEAFPPELFFTDPTFSFPDTLIPDGPPFLNDSSFSEMKEELLEARRLSREAREEYMAQIRAYQEKIREHQDKIRDLQQSYQQELREYQEEFREEHKKHREHQLELRKKQMESLREVQEARQRQSEDLRKQHRALQLQNEKFSRDLREELESDGLIDKDGPVDFRYEADKDEMRVNSKKLNKKQKNKYKELLQQYDLLPASGSFRYKIN